MCPFQATSGLADVCWYRWAIYEDQKLIYHCSGGREFQGQGSSMVLLCEVLISASTMAPGRLCALMLCLHERRMNMRSLSGKREDSLHEDRRPYAMSNTGPTFQSHHTGHSEEHQDSGEDTFKPMRHRMEIKSHAQCRTCWEGLFTLPQRE